MRKILILAAGLAVLAGPVLVGPVLVGAAQAEARSETRCGWYVNPTPGNHYLTDADGDWWMASQGGLEAAGWGLLDWSDAEFGDQWVETNGSYGYGCACITGDFGRAAEGDVWFIDTIRALPLAKCLRDPALPPPPAAGE